MKKLILISLIFLFLIMSTVGNVLGTDYGLGDMTFTANKLKILSGSAYFGNNLVSCGCDTYSGGCTPKGYNPSLVYSATQYNCGSGYALSKNFGSIVTTPGALWNCQYNYLCNFDLTLKDKLQVIHAVGSTPSCSSLGSNWIALTSSATGQFGGSSSSYRTTITAVCVKQEYYQYFKDEIYLVSAYGSYGVDPGCPSETSSISQISTATYGESPSGTMTVTKICIRTNGAAATINLDYNEQKCKTIYGSTAWGPDYSNWPGSNNQRCCGDDNEINTEVLGSSSYICEYDSSTKKYFWKKMAFEIVEIDVSNGPYNRDKTYTLTETIANHDISGTVYVGASLFTNLNSIDCPKAGCIWDDYSGCYCNLPYQTFSLGSGIQDTKTVNFKIHKSFPDGTKGIAIRLWKTSTGTCNLMPNSPYYEDGCLSNVVEGSIASYSDNSFITITPESCSIYSDWTTKTLTNGDVVKTRDSDKNGIGDQYCSSEGGVEPIILS